MTTEEVIRAATRAYSDKDLEAALSYCSEDIRFSNQSFPEAAWRFASEGMSGFRQMLIELNQAIDIIDYELVEIIANGQRAATRQNVRFLSRDTGEEFNTQICDFWTVANGKITEIQEFSDTDLFGRQMIS